MADSFNFGSKNWNLSLQEHPYVGIPTRFEPFREQLLNMKVQIYEYRTRDEDPIQFICNFCFVFLDMKFCIYWYTICRHKVLLHTISVCICHTNKTKTAWQKFSCSIDGDLIAGETEDLLPRLQADDQRVLWETPNYVRIVSCKKYCNIVSGKKLSSIA